MKDKPIQKDLMKNRVVRSAGDAPNLGHLSKGEAIKPSSKGERRRRRNTGPPEDDGESRVALLRFLGGVAAFVIIGLAVYAWGKHRFGTADALRESHETHRIQNNENVAKWPSHSMTVDVVRKALAVRESRLVGDSFRKHQNTQDEEVVAFLETMTARDGLIDGLEADQGIILNGKPVGRVWVSMERGGAKRDRLAYVVKGEDGMWRVDFESFARLVSPSWETFNKQLIVQGVVRVELVPLGPSSMSGWDCYLLTSPDLESPIPALCKWGSTQEGVLSALFEDMDTELPFRQLTLEIQKKDRAQAVTYEITRVVSDSWVLPDEEYAKELAD